MTGIPVTAFPGSTYFVAAEPFDGWVKIGRCGDGVDPVRRLRAFQTGNARELRLRAVWPVDVERSLHEYFLAFRGRSEWFAFPWRLISDIARLSDDPKPWEGLIAAWPDTRIWDEARFVVKQVSRRPESLARAFMTVESSKRERAARIRDSVRVTEKMVERALDSLRPDLVRLPHSCRFDRNGHPIPGCGCADLADLHDLEVVRRALEIAVRGLVLEELSP